MTAQLQVRAVRDALWSKSTPDASSSRSIALLGKIFHEVAATLTHERSLHHIANFLQDAPTDRESRKIAVDRSVYEKLVGPKLAAVQAQLGASADDVLSFWTAVQDLVEWLVRLVDAMVETGCTLERVKSLFGSEEAMRATFRLPAWTDEVEVSGISDLILRTPVEQSGPDTPSHQWCVIELKLGRGAIEADFGQASLYHLLLQQLGRPPGTLALLTFGPKRKETLAKPTELERLRDPLLELIGKLAGVLPAKKPVDPAPAPPVPELTELTRKLAAAFREYGVELKLGAPMIGPAFYRFAVELGRGQQVEKLKTNTANVQLRVGLREAPIVSVDQGRLVIDVERADRRTVLFAEVRAQIVEAKMPVKGALLPIGVDFSGVLRFADLGDPLNAHLLVAGTTGSGKSEWLRFALAGVALRALPEEVRFVLIDPKRTAFAELKGSPYLYGKRGLIFPDEHPVIEVLTELGDEMDRRYALFEQAGADDLASYKAKTSKVLPRILVVCDEYADLVSNGGKTQKAVDAAIGRLGAKARAAGIHLILATQQPSRQIMRGAIQTNIPCRVGLKTQKAIESQMLLNQAGAEALLGNGDLLFKDVGDPVRLQSPLTTREERRAIFHRDRL